ncbi:hypothetical protein REPUB_Repub19eG0110300 [Reevesia pubescens]
MEEINNCLVGRRLTSKGVHTDALRTVFTKVWKIFEGMQVREIGDKTFISIFMTLWTEIGFSPLNRGPLTRPWCPFWIQIHGLPIEMMNVKVGTVIAESIGDVEEVDSRGGDMVWGHFLRVRVNVNITKPLKRGTIVMDGDSIKTLVTFRYGKLSDLCYVCGNLCHQERDCSIAFRMKNELGTIRPEYGSWLRANLSKIWDENKSSSEGRKPDLFSSTYECHYLMLKWVFLQKRWMSLIENHCQP